MYFVYLKGWNMKNVTSAQAVRNFSEVMDTVRTEHVTISKNGKPVAVLYSYEEAQAIEEMKMRELKSALLKARKQKGKLFTREDLNQIKEKGMAKLKAEGKLK